MAGIKNIDRVRMTAQERLDLPDFNALLENSDQGAQKMLGNLMGRGGGLLSPMPFTLVNDGVNYWIKPGAFSYYWSKRDKAAADGTYRTWLGGVGSYNPAAEGQQLLWNYTAAKALAGTPTFMYARPKAIDTATDARRAHNGANELSVSLKTRTSVVTEFKFSTLSENDSSNDGWAPVLCISAWAPDISSYALMSVWDSMNAVLFSQQPYTGLPAGPASTGSLLTAMANGTNPGDNADIDGSAVTDRDLGIIQMFQQFKDRFYRHLDTAGTLQWVQDPPRDLVSIDTDLTALTAADVALDLRVTQLEYTITYRVYMESRGLVYTPRAWEAGDDLSGSSAILGTRVAQGIVAILFAQPAFTKVVSIHIQPADRDPGFNIAMGSRVTLSATPGEACLVYLLGPISPSWTTQYLDSSFFIDITVQVI